jgi:hypothetical protein
MRQSVLVTTTDCPTEYLQSVIKNGYKIVSFSVVDSPATNHFIVWVVVED